MNAEHLDYVIGDEHHISELLNEQDVMPLLEQARAVGLPGAVIVDNLGEPLWSAGRAETNPTTRHPLCLEGETIGAVCCSGDPAGAGIAMAIIGGALNTMLLHSLKRKLTTMVHTKVVNQSYSELLETNQRLGESEKRYRELAESLESRVQERTDELQHAYARMLQQEKLASIGQLAAGMAHEINNPLGFLLSNLSALEKYVRRFRELLLFCRDQLSRSENQDVQRRFEHRWRQLKMDLVLEDAPELIDQSRCGGERVKEIISTLKGFSHIDDIDNQVVDLNEELERTMRVMAHEVPQGAVIKWDLQTLPAWMGPPSLLCQAFYNLLRNAFQCRTDGLILTLQTRHVDDHIQVVIADNGPGIPEELHQRVFEPFYTTRDVGQGQGLGLTLVYDVVQNCQGKIRIDSGAGQGARFELLLPYRRGDHGKVC